MFYAYPPSMPFEEMQFLTTEVLGKQPKDLSRSIHAAWSVAGFAASRITPDATGELLTHDVLSAHLCNAIAGGVLSPAVWASIAATLLKTVLPLILSLLGV